MDRGVELTIAIAHEQHSMVNEPTAAEEPQWAGDPSPVELVGEKQQGPNSKEKWRSQQEMEQGQQGWGLTCMPKALMATETGPFLASQAASSDTGGAASGPPRPQPHLACPYPHPSLTLFILA